MSFHCESSIVEQLQVNVESMGFVMAAGLQEG